MGDREAEVTKGDFQGDGVLARAGGNRNAFETSEQLAEATTAAAMRSFRIVLNSGVAKRLGLAKRQRLGRCDRVLLPQNSPIGRRKLAAVERRKGCCRLRYCRRRETKGLHGTARVLYRRHNHTKRMPSVVVVSSLRAMFGYL